MGASKTVVLTVGPDAIGIDAGAGEPLLYRPPRRLGPARSLNLGLAWAAANGYEAVLVVPPGSALNEATPDLLAAAAQADPATGWVVPWSSDGAGLSLPRTATAFEEGKVVDLIAGELADEFGPSSVAVGDLGPGCVLLPLAAVAAVGLFDPVFTRGDAHRWDWVERATAAGYRGVLAPGAFVPGADPKPAGAGSGGDLLDLRHPGWRARREEAAATAHAAVAKARQRATTRLVVAAARCHGYSVQASWLPQPAGGSEVRLVVRPDGDRLTVTGHAWGVEARLSLPTDATPAEALESVIGAPPRRVTIFERGRIASQLAAATWAGEPPFVDGLTYPTRV